MTDLCSVCSLTLALERAPYRFALTKAWRLLARDADSKPSAPVHRASPRIRLQAGAEAAAARQEAQASKADSVALVERLHYVQGYQRTGRRKGGPQWVLSRLSGTLPGTGLGAHLGVHL